MQEHVGIDNPNYTHATKLSRFTVTDLTSFTSPDLQELKTADNSSTSCTVRITAERLDRQSGWPVSQPILASSSTPPPRAALTKQNENSACDLHATTQT